MPALRILPLAPLALFVGVVAAVAPAAAQSRAFDHAAFDRLLRSEVDARGLVDYDAFQRSPEFARYLQSLAAFDPGTLPEAERLAFWINAYNAYTIALVNRHSERASIRNINKSFGLLKGKGPWSEPLARVGERDYTLDEIEHEIIRKRFREPRIHFALVCAALGCPPLRREAYTGARLDAQLADQARAFLLASPAHNRVDVQRGRLHASKIFDWYREDFGGSDAAISRYVAGFYPAGAARDLLLSGRADVVFTPYDWSLNRQR